jgi:hypothetical protein
VPLQCTILCIVTLKLLTDMSIHSLKVKPYFLRLLSSGYDAVKSGTLKMEAKYSHLMFVPIYKAARNHIRQNDHLLLHSCDSFLH